MGLFRRARREAPEPPPVEYGDPFAWQLAPGGEVYEVRFCLPWTVTPVDDDQGPDRDDRGAA